MKDELYVGCKAMIIGARQPKNSYVIGKVITVEALVKIGDEVPREFIAQPGWYSPAELELWRYAQINGAFAWVEGTQMPGLVEDCFYIDQKYLMLIPPMEDPGIEDCTFTPIKQEVTV